MMNIHIEERFIWRIARDDSRIPPVSRAHLPAFARIRDMQFPATPRMSPR